VRPSTGSETDQSGRQRAGRMRRTAGPALLRPMRGLRTTIRSPRRLIIAFALVLLLPMTSAWPADKVPPRADLVASIACAPAPTAIATQLYSQATMTKMIARCTQQGESIDQAIAWASDEIEGFMRG
jgi:hypothetical protein